MLTNWMRRRFLGHPTKTKAEWSEWERDGYFMLMGKHHPIELWCAVDQDGMCHQQSMAGPDGLPAVRKWIDAQASPAAFEIVCLAAKQAA